MDTGSMLCSVSVLSFFPKCSKEISSFYKCLWEDFQKHFRTSWESQGFRCPGPPDCFWKFFPVCHRISTEKCPSVSAQRWCAVPFHYRSRWISIFV